jgi:hypothetical protein
MGLVGADGKQINRVEGPSFFCDPADASGTPDMTHINLLVMYAGKTYICMMPLREIKFEERKQGNG